MTYKNTISNSDPKIYSYIRFSTPEQSMGDSERRQLELVKSFAKEQQLMFDQGLSGYSGQHLKKGVLGEFLKCVEKGQVAPGSILVVENVDRLSREGAVKTLRNIIGKLWDHDITLQTLSPKETYEPGCDNDPKFIALFIYMQRAHDESKQKSIRISAAREKERGLARTQKKIITKRCPAWLKVKNDKFVPIPEAVETIRRIFDFKLSGLGKTSIAKQLNSDATWQPPPTKRKNKGGNGWRESYIQKILSNRALLGEYQPHHLRKPIGDPIADYYPYVIDPGTFEAVQQILSKNKGKGGRTGKASNLFQNIIKCGYCGGSMVYQNKGYKGGQVFECDNGRRGNGCHTHSFKYSEVQQLVFDYCWQLKPEQIIPNADKQKIICVNLRIQLKIKKAERLAKIKQIDNLLNAVANQDNKELQDRYNAKILLFQDETKELEAQISNLDKKLKKTETSAKSFKKWNDDLKELREAIEKNDAVELRMRLQSHMKEFIENITLYSHGVKTYIAPKIVYMSNTLFGEKPIDKKILAIAKKDCELFDRYLHEYSLSKKDRRCVGRYLKINFKSPDPVESLEYKLWPVIKINPVREYVITQEGNIDWQKTGLHLKAIYDKFRAIERMG